MEWETKRHIVLQKWESMTPFYTLVRFCTGRFGTLIARVIVAGFENVPREGPFIVAANHISLFDPPFLGGIFPRQIHFMAKQELFNGLCGDFMRAIKTFPVKRGAPDRKAISTALEYLAQGRIVGIFPQGTRVKSGSLENAEMGLALIAEKAQVPVVPVGIYYSMPGDICPRIASAIAVKVGKPLTIDKVRENRKEQFERFTREVMEAIGLLINEGRDALAGGK